MCEKNDGQRWDLPMKGKWLAYVEELYRCGQQDQYSGEIEGMRRVKFMISIFFRYTTSPANPSDQKYERCSCPMFPNLPTESNLLF